MVLIPVYNTEIAYNIMKCIEFFSIGDTQREKNVKELYNSIIQIILIIKNIISNNSTISLSQQNYLTIFICLKYIYEFVIQNHKTDMFSSTNSIWLINIPKQHILKTKQRLGLSTTIKMIKYKQRFVDISQNTQLRKKCYYVSLCYQL